VDLTISSRQLGFQRGQARIFPSDWDSPSNLARGDPAVLFEPFNLVDGHIASVAIPGPGEYLSFAKSLRRHQKDFFPLDLSTSVLDGRLIRRMAKDARKKGEPCLGGLQEKSLVFRTIAFESKLPPHNDGAARRVWERIESCSRPQSEVL